MAVTNQYKFYGVTLSTTDLTTLLTAGAAETFVLRSFRVTNNSGSNTPTISITNNAFNISYELFSVPVILENSTILKAQLAGTVSDGVSIGISYLNIKKDVVS
jgi:hypothetical protein